MKLICRFQQTLVTTAGAIGHIQVTSKSYFGQVIAIHKSVMPLLSQYRV